MAHADLKLARLLVVKIQTENATHLMFPADSAAWIISTTPARKFPSSEFNFSLCPSGRKKAAVTHQLCFSYSDSAHRPSTRLFTLQSPKVGAEQSGPSATAPWGYSCCRWLIGCYVSTLEIRERATISNWKESNEDISVSSTRARR